MKLSKITKKQITDIVIRIVKTFVATGCAAVVGIGFDNPKTWIISFVSAGFTAVLNLVIKAFEEDEGNE